MKQISDEKLREAFSLFRESVHEFRPTGVTKEARSFTAWRLALAVFAMVAILVTGVSIYRQRQADLANAAKQDDALLRQVESDVSLSVPPPMQQLELLMASDTVTESERSK